MNYITYFIGFFVRQILLPNPFENLDAFGVALNLCTGIVLAPISAFQVALLVDRKANPLLAGCLFNLAYFINTGFVYLIALLWPFGWVMYAAGAAYVLGSFLFLDAVDFAKVFHRPGTLRRNPS